MQSTLRAIDLIYLNHIIVKKTGLTTEQLMNLTGQNVETTHNVIKKLEKKGYIIKKKEGKIIKIFPPTPYIQIGIKKVFKQIKELNLYGED